MSSASEIDSGQPAQHGFCPATSTASSSTSAMPVNYAPRRKNDGQECGGTAVSEGAVAQQQYQAPPANVGELVAKAKKAAVSLWMILHAQNCRLSKEKCPHRGCSETKLLLVHVKTCPAGPDFPCPTQCRGCNETRKLLAHYRRCKDIRIKQVGLGRRSGLQPDQSCLVCSLMSRYAKSMMDRTKASSQGKSNVASLLSAASFLSSSAEGKFSVERSLANFTEQSRLSPTLKHPAKRSLSMTLMPPPPPRSRNSSNESFGSPPSPSTLMQSRIVTVAAITDPRTLAQNRLSDPSLLGKSVDSVTVPFPILKQSSRKIEVTDEELGVVIPSPTRQRAGSYDERKSRVKFAPNIITSKQYYFNEQEEQSDNTTRPRSASCSNMGHNDSNASLSSTPGCETIAEEQMEHEETVFHMD